MTKTFNQVGDMFKEAQMMTAYRTITAEHGPSEQLLAFINYDKNMSSEMGLESFDSLDLQQRHEMLLSSMDPEEVSYMALESFRETVKKYRKALLIAGLFVPFVFWAGVAGYVFNSHDKAAPCIPYKDFEDAQREFEASLKTDSSILSAMPSEFTKEAWEKFAAAHEQAESTRDSASRGGGEVSFEHSGWTETNFNGSVHWLEEAIKKVDAAKKQFAGKLENVERYANGRNDGKTDSAVLQIVAHTIGSSISAFHHTEQALEKALRIGKQVSKHFEAKK